jgi:hypothetical protein
MREPKVVLPEEVRLAFQQWGALGGRRKAARMTPAEKSVHGRRMARSRWLRARERQQRGQL